MAICELAFPGLAYNLFPYSVADRITIWDTVAHPSAPSVMLIGALIGLPSIVAWRAVQILDVQRENSEQRYDQ